jgi:hypothetical protein
MPQSLDSTSSAGAFSVAAARRDHRGGMSTRSSARLRRVGLPISYLFPYIYLHACPLDFLIGSAGGFSSRALERHVVVYRFPFSSIPYILGIY